MSFPQTTQGNADVAVPFRPSATVKQLLAALSPREADVLARRFALHGGPAETLEKIGRSYDITRERVRQIEATAIRNFLKLERAHELHMPVGVIKGYMEGKGGVVEETALFNDLLSREGVTDADRFALSFILAVRDEFIAFEDETGLKKAWGITGADLKAAREIITAVQKFLEDRKEPTSEADIRTFLASHAVTKKYPKLNADVMMDMLKLSEQLHKSPFGEWGLKTWSSVAPRGVRDKAYVVLKKHGKPMHFTEIAKAIDAAKFDMKKAHPQTVHNELIKDTKFVLVGRGIYGLKEWGFKAGTVSDVLQRILKENGPLTKEEILEAVLKERQVKKNTVLLCLQNKDKFRKEGETFTCNIIE